MKDMCPNCRVEYTGILPKTCVICRKLTNINYTSIKNTIRRLTKMLSKSNPTTLKKLRCGLTIEQYNDKLTKQGNVCAICKEPERKKGNNGKIFNLNVDHCHSSGKIRGLLCSRCNLVLGQINDDKIILKNAIDYLNTY